jgi:hypothetical protein
VRSHRHARSMTDVRPGQGVRCAVGLMVIRDRMRASAESGNSSRG